MSRSDIVTISDGSDGIIPLTSSPGILRSSPLSFLHSTTSMALLEEWNEISDLDSPVKDDGAELDAALARLKPRRRASSGPVVKESGVQDDAQSDRKRPTESLLGAAQGSDSTTDPSRVPLAKITDNVLFTAPRKRHSSSSIEADTRHQASMHVEKAARKDIRTVGSQAAREALEAERNRERDTAKMAKEAQQSLQKKVNEANRLVSKMDALREIELHFAHDLSLPSSAIAEALPEIKERLAECLSQVHFLSEEETAAESTIRFLRRVRARWDSSAKRFNPLDEECVEWESTTVVVTSVDAIVDQIAEGDHVFLEWLSDIRLSVTRRPDEQVFLLVRGMAQYHSKTVSLVNRSYRDNVTSELESQTPPIDCRAAGTTRVTKEMVETELLRAQVVAHTFVALVDSVEEIEDWLFNLAGVVAVRPYKRLSKSYLAFSAPLHQRKGATARQALEIMLQEVPGLTNGSAENIATRFSSFRELMEAYDEVMGDDVEALESMVEECESALSTGAPTSRKLGKALSKKVHDVLRGNDPLALV